MNFCKTFLASLALLGVCTLSAGTSYAVVVTAPGDIIVPAANGSGTPASHPAIQLFLNGAAAQGDIVNHLVTLSPNVGTSYNPTPVPNGPAGTFTITATFTNTGSANPIQHPYFEVTSLSGGNFLVNADNGPGGVGSTVTPEVEEGVLLRNQSVTVQFGIGLQVLAPFTFLVDMKEGALPVSHDAPAVFPVVGPTVVTFSATDAGGMSGMVSAMVTVTPIVDPNDVDNDGDGLTENQGDCDDSNAAINPNATDIPGNIIDEDCSGTDAVDTNGSDPGNGPGDDTTGENPGEDTTPPVVNITSPTDQAVFLNQTPITVVGTINDNTAAVTVNGVAASVTNGQFSAAGIPLAEGANTITASAADQAGNAGTASIVVTLTFSSSSQMLPILGPQDFVKQTSGIEQFSAVFQNCEPGAAYKLVVENGQANGTERVTGASISFNGVEIVSTQEVTLAHARLERSISIQNDNQVGMEVSGAAQSKLNISIVCTANCLGLNIESPSPNESINQLETLVTGSVVTSSLGELGVLVNQRVAMLQETNFAAPHILLPEGATTIDAKVTNACGNTATSAIQVTAIPAETTPLQLIVSLNRGLVPHQVTLRVRTDLTTPVVDISWDVDGDGTIDINGPDLFEISHTYTEPGLFFPLVTTTDAEGTVLTAQTTVLVQTKDEVEALLQAKWQNLVTPLGQGNIEQALGVIAGSRKAQYREDWTALQNELPQLAALLNRPLQLKDFRRDLVLMIDPDPFLIGEILFNLEIQWIVDQDGLWHVKAY